MFTAVEHVKIWTFVDVDIEVGLGDGWKDVVDVDVGLHHVHIRSPCHAAKETGLFFPRIRSGYQLSTHSMLVAFKQPEWLCPFLLPILFRALHCVL
jgi:hypothetical protein